jgi:hypothetical protein
MNRPAIDPDGARTTISGVTTLLDPEPSQLAQESAQTLAGLRFLRERLAVN